MNYEEKYNEILEWARKNKARLNGVPIEEALPELAESEDERIRKALIEVFKKKLERGFEWVEYGIPNRSVLDWLEKQKECLADNSKTLASEDERIRKEIYNFFKNFKETGTWKSISDVNTWLAYLEKQKDLTTENIYKHSRERMSFWNGKQKEQKPEWSEEDENCIRNLESVIYYDKNLPTDTRIKLGDFLKSLRSQPIQLKEAYKDGFQTARHAIALAFMNYCDKIRPNGKMCLSNGECEEIEKAFLVGDWEKIERYFHKYHWKPSEHQMDILKSVKEYVGKLSGYWGDGLESLIDDLEKLM